MRSLCVLLVVLLVQTTQQKFVIPEVSIQAIKPKGIVVSLKDSAGIQHFAFHGNVNNPIKGKEEGSISKQVGKAENGYWQVKDENVELKEGDVVYYWIFVQHNRLGFDKQEQKYTIQALVDEGTPPTFSSEPAEICSPSVTTINNGKRACSGAVIFEDDFSSDTVNNKKWETQLYIADAPDHEFVTYERQNIEVSEGVLNLLANLRPNAENVNSLDFRSDDCTGRTCSKALIGFLLEPVIAAQIKSRFSFKYGIIEFVAEFPKGDWVYPQLYLESKDSRQAYNNGRIWLAYSRGNADLISKEQKQLGNSVLYSGPVLSNLDPVRSSAAIIFNQQGGSWSDRFHTFRFTWKPDSMSLSVDGHTRSTSTSVSSFNKELLLTLGIGVGGKSDFPDESFSGPNRKPWRNSMYRITRAFFEDKHNWLPTWKNSEAVLRIDSIKIKAL